jgi:branched-chain amino acid aminotransferase
MNVFFIVGNTAWTPDLENSTILAGVTRDSAIKVLKAMGYEVEERPVNIDEVCDAYRNGDLKEVFGTGTAATISMIRELRYQEFVMKFDEVNWVAGPALKKKLDAIREGKTDDPYGWMLKV